MSSENPSDFLKTQFHSLPLNAVLQRPTTVLLGVTDAAASALEAIGIKNVFDLAFSRIFEAAVTLDDAADDAASALNRFGAPANDMVRPGIPGTLKVTDLRFQSVDILAGISDPAAFQTALGIVTVRDLAVYPPYRAAREIADRVFFPERREGFDPESPSELVPKSGEFPTERVQYNTLLLDEISRPAGAAPLIDLAGPNFTPVDVAAVAAADFGFSTLGLGALLTLNQSWFMQGVTLGHLLHSMALAPGESTRLAVIDWSRKSSAGQTEQIGETEDVSQDLSRNRSISEVTEAVAKEAQTGFSQTESTSTTKQAGISGGFVSGALGIGGSASIAKTKTSADSYSTTSGSREVGASTLQQANDRTHQHAHASRTRRASVVREVSQSEHEQVSTRVITNYNHMHALTVQYYEVLQVYRVETSVVRCDRVVFVPFKLLDFANENVLLRFRSTLIDAALTQPVRDALVNYDTLELVPDRQVRFPGLGGNIHDAVLTARLGAPAGGGVTPPAPVPAPAPTPAPAPFIARMASGPGAVSSQALRQRVATALWADEIIRLASTIGNVGVRRDSESLFIPADVRVLDGEVRAAAGQTLGLVYLRKDGTRVTDLQKSIPLTDIAGMSISGSNPNADVEATAALTLVRNGVVFPLELPTVVVPKGSSETSLMQIKAAGADVNLVQQLNDNRLHYSQAVFRELDAAMIAGLLSSYSITLNGRTVPLVQVAEPEPLRIVGNYLAFKINTDPASDTEWRTFMADRGIVIGQAKIDVIPLSSGGIFSEAVLGRFNCAEKLDLTRFWNWQDSPIPILPSDIAPVQTGSRATSEDLRPGSLSAPIVSITQPPSLPDPSGMAGVLSAIQNGNMFRDMSGLSDTIKLANEALKASSSGASSAASQATKSMEIAVNADLERRRIAADLQKKKSGKPLADQNPSVQGAVVNEVGKAGGSTAKAGGAASSPAAGGGTSPTGGESASSSVPDGSGPGGSSSSGNAALDAIVGNDASSVLAPGSPVSASRVTPGGVALKEWDFVGGGYTLFYKDSPAGTAVVANADQIREIIDSGDWVPTSGADFRSMLLGDRKVASADLGDLLFSLSLLPAGSLSALNIVAYASEARRLEFARDFIYVKSEESFSARSPSQASELSSLSLQQMLDLAGDASISSSNGDVRIADVRKAFAADAEVRLFNLETAVSPDFVQGIANLFQVRATGFVKQALKVTAEVAADLDPGTLALTKKIDLVGSSSLSPVDFFVNLLKEDRALTGAYIASPRQP